MECPNCKAQVTTGMLQWQTDYYHQIDESLRRHFLFLATAEDVGIIAWVAAGVMCALGE